jgi:hypothetical protein
MRHSNTLEGRERAEVGDEGQRGVAGAREEGRLELAGNGRRGRGVEEGKEAECLRRKGTDQNDVWLQEKDRRKYMYAPTDQRILHLIGSFSSFCTPKSCDVSALAFVDPTTDESCGP